MKQYIAYGTKGTNLRFNLQLEVKQYFGLTHTIQVERFIERGLPIKDPHTNELYYLDELESDFGPRKPSDMKLED